MGCDPACVKIIINGGLMAPLASELAGKVGGRLRSAALELAAAARSLYTSYTVLVEQELIEPFSSAAWSGCDQATLLTEWIAGGAGDDAADKMTAWASAMREITASLVSGQFEVS